MFVPDHVGFADVMGVVKINLVAMIFESKTVKSLNDVDSHSSF